MNKVRLPSRSRGSYKHRCDVTDKEKHFAKSVLQSEAGSRAVIGTDTMRFSRGLVRLFNAKVGDLWLNENNAASGILVGKVDSHYSSAVNEENKNEYLRERYFIIALFSFAFRSVPSLLDIPWDVDVLK